MTVEADIFDAIKGLVSNRCYPDVAPSGVVTPYIVYQQVGGESEIYLENVLPSKKNGRFQIAVWSTTRAQASLVGRQVEAAMVASTDFQAQPIGDLTADFDSTTNLRGTRQDFSVWSDR